MASSRDIKAAWFSAACLIRAFFATYYSVGVGASGVLEQSGDPQKIRPVGTSRGKRHYEKKEEVKTTFGFLGCAAGRAAAARKVMVLECQGTLRNASNSEE